MSTPTQNAASPLSEERVREIGYELATIVGPTGWRWSQCYEITNEIGVTEKHWALTNDESDARGIVVSGWLVLAATEPRDYDGRPLDENREMRFVANAPTYLAELLADRTALTARLEAVERQLAEVTRLTDEEETVIASLRWRVENYRRHMTESGAAGGDMLVSGDHLECLIEAIDRLVPAPNHPSPART